MFPWGNCLYPHEIHSLLHINEKCATFVKHLIKDRHYIDHCIEIFSKITHEGKSYDIKMDKGFNALLQSLQLCRNLPMFIFRFPLVFLQKIRDAPPLTH